MYVRSNLAAFFAAATTVAAPVQAETYPEGAGDGRNRVSHVVRGERRLDAACERTALLTHLRVDRRLADDSPLRWLGNPHSPSKQ